MGHVANADQQYLLLQQRLDRMVTGAPESPVFLILFINKVIVKGIKEFS